MFIIFTGAIIVVIGGIIGAYGTLMHNQKSSEKSTKTLAELLLMKEQNNNLTSEAILLKEKMENQADKIDALREENTELYSKLADASKEIHNNLTGGDSYCKMAIGQIDPTGSIGYLVFTVEGKYPLSNIQAKVTDLNLPLIFTMDDLSKNVVNIGTLEPGKVYLDNKVTWKLDKEKGVNLMVQFGANNGAFMQSIRMRFINDKWVRATRVSTFEGSILATIIDPNYPEQNAEMIFK